ncbi:Hypothetical predicted protein [Octopus vulgaris]|uniref:Uncharacterized protein n=1 Tax=Octopus vulgaris TaxID=6645 RepID=A0AA36BM92_OCTVU|nr:Hypothetical predicted protein [Octopus vulgaris]
MVESLWSEVSPENELEPKTGVAGTWLSHSVVRAGINGIPTKNSSGVVPLSTHTTEGVVHKSKNFNSTVEPDGPSAVVGFVTIPTANL